MHAQTNVFFCGREFALVSLRRQKQKTRPDEKNGSDRNADFDNKIKHRFDKLRNGGDPATDDIAVIFVRKSGKRKKS